MSHSLNPKARKRLAFLSERKSRIERLIDRETTKRLPCSLTLQYLKKLKLNIRDRMTPLQFWPDDRNFGKA